MNILFNINIKNLKNLFKEKSAFDISPLKDKDMAKLIQEATTKTNSGRDLYVDQQYLHQVSSRCHDIRSCAVVITYLLRIFDELGSHPVPVYKALVIMYYLLKGGNKNCILVCRAFVPEIESCLYLSFGEKNTDVSNKVMLETLRTRIHLITSAIYDFLMYEAELPDIHSFDHLKGRVHRPAPPPDESDPEPVGFMYEEPPPPVEEEDDELDFEVNHAPTSPPVVERYVEPPPPPPTIDDLVKMEPVPPPKAPTPPPPEPEPEIEIPPKTEQDLQFIRALQFVSKTVYDDTIESY